MRSQPDAREVALAMNFLQHGIYNCGEWIDELGFKKPSNIQSRFRKKGASLARDVLRHIVPVPDSGGPLLGMALLVSHLSAWLYRFVRGNKDRMIAKGHWRWNAMVTSFLLEVGGIAGLCLDSPELARRIIAASLPARDIRTPHVKAWAEGKETIVLCPYHFLPPLPFTRPQLMARQWEKEWTIVQLSPAVTTALNDYAKDVASESFPSFDPGPPLRLRLSHGQRYEHIEPVILKASAKLCCKHIDYWSRDVRFFCGKCRAGQAERTS